MTSEIRHQSLRTLIRRHPRTDGRRIDEQHRVRLGTRCASARSGTPDKYAELEPTADLHRRRSRAPRPTARAVERSGPSGLARPPHALGLLVACSSTWISARRPMMRSGGTATCARSTRREGSIYSASSMGGSTPASSAGMLGGLLATSRRPATARIQTPESARLQPRDCCGDDASTTSRKATRPDGASQRIAWHLGHRIAIGASPRGRTHPERRVTCLAEGIAGSDPDNGRRRDACFAADRRNAASGSLTMPRLPEFVHRRCGL